MKSNADALVEQILSDWTIYDEHKNEREENISEFICIREWERNYLIDKIQRAFPQHRKAIIRTAINITCADARSPRQRHEFVKKVMETLHLLTAGH